MTSLLPKAILYPFIGVCLLAAFNQYEYFSDWLADVENPVRHENLAGAFLTGILFSFGWTGALVLAFWKKEMFSKIDRTIAIVCASLVVMGTIISLVLDIAT